MFLPSLGGHIGRVQLVPCEPASFCSLAYVTVRCSTSSTTITHHFTGHPKLDPASECLKGNICLAGGHQHGRKCVVQLALTIICVLPKHRRMIFEVGILTPDWLVEDSQFLGNEVVNNITTAVFTKVSCRMILPVPWKQSRTARTCFPPATSEYHWQGLYATLVCSCFAVVDVCGSAHTDPLPSRGLT